MGPISTGLGEIYQYTLKVDSAHQGDLYSSSDLTDDARLDCQQANGYGSWSSGNQCHWWEKSNNMKWPLHPDELKAIGLTIVDVYKALEAQQPKYRWSIHRKGSLCEFYPGRRVSARSISRTLRTSLVKNVNGSANFR